MTKEYYNRKRGDLGYGWSIKDKIRPLVKSIKFYKEKTLDKSVSLDDVRVFTIALRNAEKELSLLRIEEDYCNKHKDVAYSLKGVIKG